MLPFVPSLARRVHFGQQNGRRIAAESALVFGMIAAHRSQDHATRARIMTMPVVVTTVKPAIGKHHGGTRRTASIVSEFDPDAPK